MQEEITNRALTLRYRQYHLLLLDEAEHVLTSTGYEAEYMGSIKWEVSSRLSWNMKPMKATWKRPTIGE